MTDVQIIPAFTLPFKTALTVQRTLCSRSVRPQSRVLEFGHQLAQCAADYDRAANIEIFLKTHCPADEPPRANTERMTIDPIGGQSFVCS